MEMGQVEVFFPMLCRSFKKTLLVLIPKKDALLFNAEKMVHFNNFFLHDATKNLVIWMYDRFHLFPRCVPGTVFHGLEDHITKGIWSSRRCLYKMIVVVESLNSDKWGRLQGIKVGNWHLKYSSTTKFQKMHCFSLQKKTISLLGLQEDWNHLPSMRGLLSLVPFVLSTCVNGELFWNCKRSFLVVN